MLFAYVAQNELHALLGNSMAVYYCLRVNHFLCF